jgi:hypothetical protein
MSKSVSFVATFKKKHGSLQKACWHIGSLLERDYRKFGSHRNKSCGGENSADASKRPLLLALRTRYSKVSRDPQNTDGRHSINKVHCGNTDSTGHRTNTLFMRQHHGLPQSLASLQWCLSLSQRRERQQQNQAQHFTSNDFSLEWLLPVLWRKRGSEDKIMDTFGRTFEKRRRQTDTRTYVRIQSVTHRVKADT